MNSKEYRHSDKVILEPSVGRILIVRGLRITNYRYSWRRANLLHSLAKGWRRFLYPGSTEYVR